jgi:predicted nucleic acid-binding Zn ribbon protein
MKQLSGILHRSFREREIVRAAEVGQASRHWPEIAGEALAKHSWPDRYEAGTLYVATSGHAWAQELRLRKEVLLERIAEVLHNRALVRDIRFGVRKLPERPETAKKKSPQAKSGESFEEIKKRILDRADEA